VPGLPIHGALPVAGGTDLFVHPRPEMLNAPMVFVEEHPELHGIRVTEDICRIGATTTVEELLESALLEARIPHLHGFLARMGGTPVRDRATVGGNLVNASPIGDLSICLPVKLVLRRDEDMAITGKRHPYVADYRIGLDREGRIHAYVVDLHQNAGAYADLSGAVLARTLFHASGAYAIPHLRATAWSCRTHLPPFTAMRGFGAPQGVFVLECAIDRAARQSGIPADVIRAPQPSTGRGPLPVRHDGRSLPRPPLLGAGHGPLRSGGLAAAHRRLQCRQSRGEEGAGLFAVGLRDLLHPYPFLIRKELQLAPRSVATRSQVTDFQG
jgi:hypothetical protein